MKNAPVLPMLVLLGACAQDATVYPSLARRPIESVDLTAPPAVTEPALVADPALDARIAGFRRELARIGSGFGEAATRARTRAGTAAARRVGSDAWLDAQTALAALDDWRAQATDLASRVDAAARDRATALVPPYPDLATLQGEIEAEIARQAQAIDALQAATPAA